MTIDEAKKNFTEALEFLVKNGIYPNIWYDVWEPKMCKKPWITKKEILDNLKSISE